MKRNCFHLLPGLVLISAVCSLHAEDARIIVRVQNRSTIDAGVVAKAEQVADMIFEDARQELVWVDCGANEAQCKQPLEDEELVIKLTSTDKEGVQALAVPAIGAALVSADGTPPTYAFVFCDLLQDLMSKNPKVDLAVALGYIMAHELGHLLLGSKSHSAAGLMQGRFGAPQFKLAERGALRFDREQAERIRAEARKRNAASHLARSNLDK